MDQSSTKPETFEMQGVCCREAGQGNFVSHKQNVHRPNNQLRFYNEDATVTLGAIRVSGNHHITLNSLFVSRLKIATQHCRAVNDVMSYHKRLELIIRELCCQVQDHEIC